ncbi:hypothetical protein ACRALDRAFT_212555 [Sodiomyces alcalophilus JCM 7366]|uniref:uncharacterized protein n=1 Tax=Sodiomyces alcalophilus JCM 7366 TaxID=591952 RepID=UPI0039B4D86D
MVPYSKETKEGSCLELDACLVYQASVLGYSFNICSPDPGRLRMNIYESTPSTSLVSLYHLHHLPVARPVVPHSLFATLRPLSVLAHQDGQWKNILVHVINVSLDLYNVSGRMASAQKQLFGEPGTIVTDRNVPLSSSLLVTPVIRFEDRKPYGILASNSNGAEPCRRSSLARSRLNRHAAKAGFRGTGRPFRSAEWTAIMSSVGEMGHILPALTKIRDDSNDVRTSSLTTGCLGISRSMSERSSISASPALRGGRSKQSNGAMHGNCPILCFLDKSLNDLPFVVAPLHTSYAAQILAHVQSLYGKFLPHLIRSLHLNLACRRLEIGSDARVLVGDPLRRRRTNPSSAREWLAAGIYHHQILVCVPRCGASGRFALHISGQKGQKGLLESTREVLVDSAFVSLGSPIILVRVGAGPKISMPGLLNETVPVYMIWHKARHDVKHTPCPAEIRSANIDENEKRLYGLDVSRDFNVLYPTTIAQHGHSSEALFMPALKAENPETGDRAISRKSVKLQSKDRG